MIIRLIVIVVLFSTVFTGCQEFLPPREDPNEYFDTILSTEYDVFYPDNPAYRRNQLIIYLTVINKYDDVIQDYVDVSGAVEIHWQIPPGQNQFGVNPNRTGILKHPNLIRAKGYDRATGLLTFTPNDTIVLAWTWNFVSDDSTNLMGKFSQQIDYACQVIDAPGHTTYRRVTTLQQFTASASVRLTKRSSTFYFGPITFSRCFVVPYLAPMRQPDGHDCIDESGIDPCKLIQ
jgi:hypothetical protein